MTLPAEETNNLIEKINSFRKYPSKLDSFTAASIKRDAEKLKKNNFTASMMLLGMLAALQNQKEEMISYFEKALNSSGKNDSVVLSNYGSALVTLGMFNDAKNILYKLMNLGLDRSFVCEKLNYIGRYNLAREYSDSDASRNISLSDTRGLDALDEQTAAAVSLAVTHLVDNNYLVLGSKIRSIHGCVVHTLITSAGPDDLANMEYSLTEQLVDKNLDLDGLAICYSGNDTWQ